MIRDSVRCNLLIALLFSFLIIMLPVAIAQELSVQKVSGGLGVSGFALPDEPVQVVMLASLPASLERGDITADQVRVVFPSETVFFDACEKKATVTECRVSLPSDGTVGRREVDVVIFDDNNQEVLRKKVSFVVDAQRPVVESFSLVPELSQSGQVQLVFKVVDPEVGGACSGIREVQFIENGNVVRSDPAGGACVHENVLLHTKPVTLFERSSLCARARDVSGVTSLPVCRTLTVDTSPPVPERVVLMDSTGTQLTHLKTGETRNLDVVVFMKSEGDLVSESVTADLSALAPGTSVKRADEVLTDRAVWLNVPVSLPRDCRVGVSAVDRAGNAQNKVLACSLLVDDEPPRPVKISSFVDRAGVPVLGSEGVLFADFEDAGVGMSPAKVFLDMSQLGLGVVRADECNKAGGVVWRCRWDVAPRVDGVRAVRLVQSSDALGNPSPELEQQVEVDTVPPQVSPQLKIVVSSEGEDRGDVLVAGSRVRMEASGTGIDRAVGNFTAIGGGIVEGTCSSEVSQQCVVSSSVVFSGPYNASLHVDFFDLAGNAVKLSTNVEVAGLLEGEVPNFWFVSEPRCSPSLIDRSTTSLAAHPVFCHVRLQTVIPDVVPAATVLPDPALCTGDTAGFISDLQMVNNGVGSRDPVLKITLETTEFDVNNVKFNCPLNVFTKIGDKVTAIPEKENVSVTLEFYNLPLGELAKNVDEEVEKAIDNAEVLGEWIGTVDKVIGYAGKICTIKSAINSVIAAIDSVIDTLVILGYALKIIPPTSNIGDGLLEVSRDLCKVPSGTLNKLLSKQTEGLQPLFNVLDKFCLFATCRLAPVEGKPVSKGDHILDGFAFFGGGGNWCANVQDLLSGHLADPFFEFGKTPQTAEEQEAFEQTPAGVLRKEKVSDVDLRSQDAKKKQDEADEVVREKWEQVGGVQQLVDVKESLIWSTVCLCVPGIFHNLNKLRQIQCKYATCVARDVAEKGLPLSFCKDVRSQQYCKFIIGEIFMLFPVVQLWQQVTGIFKDAFSNPFAAVSLVSGCLCGGCAGIAPVDLCQTKETMLGFFVCTVPKTAARIGDAVASVQGLINTDQWKTGNDFCDELESVKEEIEEKEGG